MPSPCKVCSHPDITTINTKLSAGVQPSKIAREYSLHHKAVCRHREKHAFVQAHKAALEGITADSAGTLLSATRQALSNAQALASASLGRGDTRVAAAMAREIGRLLGMLRDLEVQERATTGHAQGIARFNGESATAILARKLGLPPSTVVQMESERALRESDAASSTRSASPRSGEGRER